MEETSQKRKKVCIVDDEANIREIYQTVLEKYGYEVITAADGIEGLKVIGEERPNVVLADIMMPKMDGVEMIRQIRKDKNLWKIPVVVMTNVDDRDIIKKTGQLDAAFYLVKSLFDPQKVVGIVDEVLHGR